MENKIITLLVENSAELIKNNKQLAETNTLALEIIEQQQKEEKETNTYLKEKYQALTDKQNRSVQEESEYIFLKKRLTGR